MITDDELNDRMVKMVMPGKAFNFQRKYWRPLSKSVDCSNIFCSFNILSRCDPQRHNWCVPQWKCFGSTVPHRFQSLVDRTSGKGLPCVYETHNTYEKYLTKPPHVILIYPYLISPKDTPFQRLPQIHPQKMLKGKGSRQHAPQPPRSACGGCTLPCTWVQPPYQWLASLPHRSPSSCQPWIPTGPRCWPYPQTPRNCKAMKKTKKSLNYNRLFL